MRHVWVPAEMPRYFMVVDARDILHGRLCQNMVRCHSPRSTIIVARFRIFYVLLRHGLHLGPERSWLTGVRGVSQEKLIRDTICAFSVSRMAAAEHDMSTWSFTSLSPFLEPGRCFTTLSVLSAACAPPFTFSNGGAVSCPCGVEREPRYYTRFKRVSRSARQVAKRLCSGNILTKA